MNEKHDPLSLAEDWKYLRERIVRALGIPEEFLNFPLCSQAGSQLWSAIISRMADKDKRILALERALTEVNEVRRELEKTLRSSLMALEPLREITDRLKEPCMEMISFVETESGGYEVYCMSKSFGRVRCVEVVDPRSKDRQAWWRAMTDTGKLSAKRFLTRREAALSLLRRKRRR